jgi:two-component system, NarL family, nitrate/nitrite response regulator NarL
MAAADTLLGEIDVLVVAGIRLYSEGLTLALEQTAHIRAVGTTASLDQLTTRLLELRPTVVLLDMGAPDGTTMIQTILDASPKSRVIALGMGESESEIIALAEAGIAGYVAREGSISDLVATIDSILRGELLCPPWVAGTLLRRVATLAADRRPWPQRARLSRRELEVVELIDEGLSNKEIAHRLCIELATVKNHVHNILEKLHVRRRSEAADLVRRNRLGLKHAIRARPGN